MFTYATSPLIESTYRHLSPFLYASSIEASFSSGDAKYDLTWSNASFTGSSSSVSVSRSISSAVVVSPLDSLSSAPVADSVSSAKTFTVMTDVIAPRIIIAAKSIDIILFIFFILSLSCLRYILYLNSVTIFVTRPTIFPTSAEKRRIMNIINTIPTRVLTIINIFLPIV